MSSAAYKTDGYGNCSHVKDNEDLEKLDESESVCSPFYLCQVSFKWIRL